MVSRELVLRSKPGEEKAIEGMKDLSIEDRPRASPCQSLVSNNTSSSRLNHTSSELGSRASSPKTSEAEDEAQLSTGQHESIPLHPYFAAGYQKQLEQQKMLCWVIEDQLKEANDPNLDNLIKLAQETGTNISSVTRTIAVLGDTGVGKSSLINSLLDCPDLAREGQGGEAVTSAATEFRYLEGDETGYVVDIEYQTQEEIRQTLSEYIWDAQYLHLQDIQNSQSPKDDKDQLSGDEQRQLQHKARIAQDALKVVFGHHRELVKILTRHEEFVNDAALVKLLEWSNDIQWPATDKDGKLRRHTNDVEECGEILSRFTSGTLWPFLKVARIYLKSPLLQHGVILVDLPGLRDTNAARVKATQEYLTKVDHVFIVAGIIRGASNDATNSPLYEVLKTNFPNEWNNTGTDHRGSTIICTRSEEMQFEKIAKDYVGRRQMIPREEFNQLKVRIKEAHTCKDRDRLETQLRHLFMKARNQFVSTSILQSCANDMRSPDLKVFCVSNIEYENGRDQNNTVMLAASQIPALRRHCYEIIADHRLTEAQNFLLVRLPSLLQSVKLYTMPKRQVDPTRLQALASIKECFGSAQRLVEEKFAETPRMIVKCSRQLEGFEEDSLWAEAATEQHYPYSNWHHSSYSAFVRNNGFHRTGAQGEHCWNAQFSKQMRIDLTDFWGSIKETILDHVNKLATILEKQTKKLAVAGKDMPEFSHAVKLLASTIELDLDKINHATISQIKYVRTKVNEDNLTSFMDETMKPAYRKAASEHGPGMSRRQKDCIGGHLNEELFASIALNIRLGIQVALCIMDIRLQELRTAYMDNIEGYIKVLERKIMDQKSSEPVRDHTTLRKCLGEWLIESGKGVKLAKVTETKRDRSGIRAR